MTLLWPKMWHQMNSMTTIMNFSYQCQVKYQMKGYDFSIWNEWKVFTSMKYWSNYLSFVLSFVIWRSSEVSFLVMDWSNECFFLKVKNIIYMYIYHYMYKTETKQAVLQLWGHTLIIFLGWMVPRYFSTCSTHFQFFYNFFFDHKTEEYIMKLLHKVTFGHVASESLVHQQILSNIFLIVKYVNCCTFLYF